MAATSVPATVDVTKVAGVDKVKGKVAVRTAPGIGPIGATTIVMSVAMIIGVEAQAVQAAAVADARAIARSQRAAALGARVNPAVLSDRRTASAGTTRHRMQVARTANSVGHIFRRVDSGRLVGPVLALDSCDLAGAERSLLSA